MTFNEEKHLIKGKNTDLGRNDTKNWEIRSFWGQVQSKMGHYRSIYQVTRDNNAL